MNTERKGNRQMQKKEFYFDSRDGVSKIHAVEWIPKQEPVAIVQIVHGMAEYIERYEELAEYLTGHGILVVGDDHLGHGKTAEKNQAPFGYFCKKDAATVLVRDEHRLKKLIEEQYPTVPYIILGHSMGSFITRNYLCRYGNGIKAAVICGTGDQAMGLVNMGLFLVKVTKLFKGEKHVAKFIDKMSFGSYNNRIENKSTDYDWLSRNKENVEAYIKDPECGFIFTVNGFETLLTLVKRLKDKTYIEKMPKELPIFFIAGKEDPVGEYGEAVKRVYQQFQEIGMKDVSIKLYENDRHEIFNEDDKKMIFEDVYQWIVKKIG